MHNSTGPPFHPLLLLLHLLSPLYPLLSQAYKHTHTPAPPLPLSSKPQTRQQYAVQKSMSPYLSFGVIFTILVFQANFMVSVSFMIRGQHQSSGVIHQRKEDNLFLL